MIPVGLSRQADILVSLSDECQKTLASTATQQRLLNLLKKEVPCAARRSITPTQTDGKTLDTLRPNQSPPGNIAPTAGFC